MADSPENAIAVLQSFQLQHEVGPHVPILNLERSKLCAQIMQLFQVHESPSVARNGQVAALSAAPVIGVKDSLDIN